MKQVFTRLIMLIMIALLVVPAPLAANAAVPTQAAALDSWLQGQTLDFGLDSNQAESPLQPTAFFTVTLLHTNDFHGNLEPAGSNPGLARLAKVVNDVRTSVGTDNVLLLDAGDEMQGSLLSNLQQGAPTIAAFNLLDYAAATFGNHEFDWGQTVLADRVAEANYPYLAANLVEQGAAANCAAAGWTAPAFVDAPFIIKTVGTAPNTVDIGIIGVTSPETPYITIASATAGLCFKDAADSIVHYYDDMKTAGADVIVVLSHLGYNDGGYGYGFTVYGDQTLAGKLNTAGKPVDLIIGGHSHTNLSAAVKVGDTVVAQAYYAGRRVGRADIGFDPTTNSVRINWQSLSVSTSGAKDAAMEALIATYTNDPVYQAKINQVVGYTGMPLTRNYNGESTMGNMVQNAVYTVLNENPASQADMVFNNPGGLRADITTTLTYPFTLTYGATFSVLPFGNQTIIGDMTGAQIVELLNQSATLFKGALQPGGLKYKFYRYQKAHPVGGATTMWAWGAFDIEVWDKVGLAWEPLEIGKTYRVATNEFLAPAGQDGFAPFKYMTNISYYGDMLNQVNAYLLAHHGTPATAYNMPLDGRIVRDGDDAGGSIVPLTILHHNDSHGRLLPSGTYPGYTNLATLIKNERQLNPDRTLLLTSGDNIQGDAMMYYFRTAPLGYATDGITLPVGLTTHPLVAAFNQIGYDGWVLGNHEFNFGSAVFKGIIGQINFPVMQANVSDSGAYGLAEANVLPSTLKTVGPEGIKVAIMGIGNHRVPNYELPSNILGLTFTDPIASAQSMAPGLAAANDVVIALTHIGFTTQPGSLEVDNNVDTYLAAQVGGIDAIVGGHSHTNPTLGQAPYKWLPALVGSPDNTPVVISQANRYNTFLGEIMLGLRANGSGGYDVVARTGKAVAVTTSIPEDVETKDLLAPYQAYFLAYNNTEVGQTTAPIDTLNAFTEETNGANLQADASVWELAQHGINVDFHLSGAMTNRKIADSATPATPFTIKISDLFNAMPYENSLLTMSINGPQLKAILERAYRNYFYYKYVPGYGGYSHYTTCMLDINSIGKITYNDTYPAKPDGNNVIALEVNGHPVNLADASTYYHVSTVNYLAAGSCNFNDGGVSLWPLNQIVNDTQYYVRDVVINYMKHMGTISPAIEGRLAFTQPTITTAVGTGAMNISYPGSNGLEVGVTFPANTFSQPMTMAYTQLEEPGLGGFFFGGVAFNLIVYGADNNPITNFGRPITISIDYKDEDVANLDENTLMLKYWNGSEWTDAACGAYNRYPSLNYFTVQICHLSRFAVTANGKHYLPVMGK